MGTANTTPKPVRLKLVDRAPGPTSSPREQSEWRDSVNDAIKDITFALQGVLGNPSINLESSTVISDLSDTAPTAMPPDTTSAAGTGNKASRYDHTHSVTAQAPSDLAVGTATSVEGSGTSFVRNDHVHATPIGSPANVGTAAADGTSGTFCHSDHVHDLGTAGDTNYIRQDGVGTPISGDIESNGSAILGKINDSTKQLGAVYTAGMGGDGSFILRPVSSAGTNNPTLQLAHQAVYPTTGINVTDGASNAWQAGAISNELIAIENVTQLNELAACGGAYDMDGNTLTDFGGCTSSNAALLEFKADIAGAAGVVGVRMTWNEGTAASSNEWPFAISYYDGSSTTDRFKFGFWNQPAATAMATQFMPVTTGGTDGFAIVTGDDASASASISDSNNCGIVWYPSFQSGTARFYCGGSYGLEIKKNGNNVSIGSGWILTSNSVFKLRSVVASSTFDTGGSYQFSHNSAATLGGGGRMFNWYNGSPPAGTGNTDYTTTILYIDDNAHIFSGQNGDAAVVPTDGGVGAAGWVDTDGAGGDQTGADFYVKAGPGTGDSDVKGDIIFQTPDAGASGTTVQSLTTKATIFREGGLQMTELSADPSDPPEGSWVIWMSDGTGSGDDGDIIVKITAGGSTKSSTLADFSAL